MKATPIDDGPTTAYVLVGEPEEDPVAALNDFVRTHDLTAAQITAIGGFRQATLGWFDREAKDYRRIEIGEQAEVLSLVGDVAMGSDGPQLHAHAVLGLADGTVRGGHLLAASVWPTLEVVLRASPAQLRKTSRPEIGLALIDVEISGRTRLGDLPA
jgi:predicted DNA-binding protein with PD1-like motif